MLPRALSFFLFNFFLTKIIVVSFLLANFFKPIHFSAVFPAYFAKEFGNFKFLVFLKKIGMFGLEVEVDSWIGGKYLLAEAGVDAWEGVAQGRDAALARTHPLINYYHPNTINTPQKHHPSHYGQLL